MKRLAALILVLCLFLGGCAAIDHAADKNTIENLQSVGEYSDSPYAVINDNKPEFTQEEITDKAFDILGGLNNENQN